MINTINYIVNKFRYKKYDPAISTINPKIEVELKKYKNSNKPIISQYLRRIINFNVTRKGTLLYFNKFIAYKVNYNNYFLVKNIYKLLYLSFKGMYSLISKPVFVYKPDKIIIRLFYFSFIPNFQLFKKYKKRSQKFKRKFKRRKNKRNKKFNLKSKSKYNSISKSKLKLKSKLKSKLKKKDLK